MSFCTKHHTRLTHPPRKSAENNPFLPLEKSNSFRTASAPRSRAPARIQRRAPSSSSRTYDSTSRRKERARTRRAKRSKPIRRRLNSSGPRCENWETSTWTTLSERRTELIVRWWAKASNKELLASCWRKSWRISRKPSTTRKSKFIFFMRKIRFVSWRFCSVKNEFVRKCGREFVRRRREIKAIFINSYDRFLCTKVAVSVRSFESVFFDYESWISYYNNSRREKVFVKEN